MTITRGPVSSLPTMQNWVNLNDTIAWYIPLELQEYVYTHPTLVDAHQLVAQDSNTAIIVSPQSTSSVSPWTACTFEMSGNESPSAAFHTNLREWYARLQKLFQERNAIRPLVHIIECIETFLDLLVILLVLGIRSVIILQHRCQIRTKRQGPISVYHITKELTEEEKLNKTNHVH